jgi:hypothetical protein
MRYALQYYETPLRHTAEEEGRANIILKVEQEKKEEIKSCARLCKEICEGFEKNSKERDKVKS